jgi:hypothetical protein
MSCHACDFFLPLLVSPWGHGRTSSVHWARHVVGSACTICVAWLPGGPAGVPRDHRVGLDVIAKHIGRSQSAVVEPSLLRVASHLAPAGWSFPKPD